MWTKLMVCDPLLLILLAVSQMKVFEGLRAIDQHWKLLAVLERELGQVLEKGRVVSCCRGLCLV